MKDNLSTHSQVAERQLACESITWVCSDKEYELKHHIKKTETPLSTIWLGNSFAVGETIAPS